MTTHDTLPDYFDPVIDAVENALLIAFDGCHKIYLAMDEGEADWFRENYSPNIFEGTPEEMLNLLVAWWDNSCSLKFITAVHTNHADPNAGYISLIGQGDWWEDEEDEEDWDEDDE
jgi:hypothetical protein